MYPLCRHIKTNGIQCQSPALRDQPFCYFHHNLRDKDRVTGRTVNCTRTVRIYNADGSYELEPYPDPAHHIIELGLLEDADSIQVAISTVVSAIGRNSIDKTRAGRLLYGLRLAANVQCFRGRRPRGRSRQVTDTATIERKTIAGSFKEISIPDAIAASAPVPDAAQTVPKMELNSPE